MRAGLVQSPSEYRWSSYPCYVRGAKIPEWLSTELVLGYFDESGRKSLGRYRDFVEQALPRDEGSPLKAVFASTILGSEAFIEKVKRLYLGQKKFQRRDVPAARQILRGPTLDEIDKAVTAVVGEDHRLAKKLCVYFGHRYSGMSLIEIGEHLRMEGAAVSQSSKRFSLEIAKEKEVRKVVRKIGDRLSLLNVET